LSNILDIDKRHIWHPFTQHATERDPIVVSRAKGASLFDEDGNEILDLISSWWTCIHGHAHPAIINAISEQAATLEHVMFAGFTHPPAAQLSKALTDTRRNLETGLPAGARGVEQMADGISRPQRQSDRLVLAGEQGQANGIGAVEFEPAVFR
jgi:4-aminobutyrate aminotransferase-like enzyme